MNKLGKAKIAVIHAEFLAWARQEAACIERGESKPYHAVLCDPPYGLEFMGQEWDAPHRLWDKRAGTEDAKLIGTGSIRNAPIFEAGFPYQSWTTEWAKALIPLLHPGALCFIFGGTRTWHRLTCGLEEAGFEVWDTLMWLHGQGFPKAQDVGAMLDKKACRERGEHESNREHTCRRTPEGDSRRGWKSSALKPAWEPVLCVKAQMQGKTYAELALEHGSGALNVEAGRIGVESVPSNQWDDGAKPFGGGAGHPYTPTQRRGRYPANLALECTCETVEEVDEAGGFVTRGSNRVQKFGMGRQEQVPLPSGKVIRHTDPNCPAFMLDEQGGFPLRTDSGGPSRFFYQSKASRSEREAGCENLETVTRHRVNPGGLENEPRWAPTQVKNDHPTVKPIALCRWLAAMLLPPESVKPRRLLVPFCGSGSEMLGAMRVGWDEVVGIEQDAHYADIARARLAFQESDD